MVSEKISPIDIKPALDRNTLYFILGATSELIRRVKADSDPRDITDLRVYLSALTTPPDTTVERYLSELGMHEELQTIRQERTHVGVMFEGFFSGLRNKDGIYWFDSEDPLLRETMLQDYLKLDSDTQCTVTYRFGQYNIQWVLPKPEVYWQCNDPDKLIHIAMIALEEMIHINQLKGNSVVLHTFGNEYNLSDVEHYDLYDFVKRMMEIDVANILTTAMPEMIEENWDWYAVRKSKHKHEDHYPHTADFGFLLGFAVAHAMDQEREFLARAMTYMPEYLNNNPNAREIFFSNYCVLGQIKTYLGWIYEPEGEPRLTPQQQVMVLNHEFSKEGMTMQFLINCIHFKDKHGTNWLEMLDKGLVDSETHATKHATEIVQMVLNFVNENPKWFDTLRGNSSVRSIKFNRKFKSPDHMLEALSRSYK